MSIGALQHSNIFKGLSRAAIESRKWVGADVWWHLYPKDLLAELKKISVHLANNNLTFSPLQSHV